MGSQVVKGSQYETKNLWELLDKEQKVVIPLIQRDYAQGRKEESKKREKILGDIHDAIINKNEHGFLFVYGKKENDEYNPLDGQQRLTTLWLVHWFIAFKARRLKDPKMARLQNFSYKTRTSATKFCERLCTKTNYREYLKEKVLNSELTLSDYIKNQTWFFSEWIWDPTIEAMLRTISGDSEPTERKKDCIEEIFSDLDSHMCEGLIKTINTDKSFTKCLTFKDIPMEEELGIPDELYVKMNSRGKPLTFFENFKNDLETWLKNEYRNDAEKKELIDEIIKKIDNEWTDAVWNNLKEINENAFKEYLKLYFEKKENWDAKENSLPEEFIVDDVLYTFVNKYFLCKDCLAEEYTPNNYKEKEERNEEDAILKSFDILNMGTEKNDIFTNIYEPTVSLELIQDINIIFEKLNDISFYNKIKKKLEEYFGEENNKETISWFIPYFVKDGKIGRIEDKVQKTQNNYVYFWALVQFIKGIDINDSNIDIKLDRWVRIIHNLVENAGIDTVPAMVTCIRNIDKLAKKTELYGWNIYFTLFYQKETLSLSSMYERQLAEEIEKVNKIIDDFSYESKIIRAEKYAFFTGTIRFLFQDEDGRIAWEYFEKKWWNARALFRDKNIINSTNREFMKMFSCFDDFIFELQKTKKNGNTVTELYPFYFTSVGFDTAHLWNWKTDILCSEIKEGYVEKINPELHKKAHYFLVNPTMAVQEVRKKVKIVLENASHNKYWDYKEFDDFCNAYHTNLEGEREGLLEYIWQDEGRKYHYEKNENCRMIIKKGTKKNDAIVLRRGNEPNSYESTIAEYTRFKKVCDKGFLKLINPNNLFYEINNQDRFLLWGKIIDFEQYDNNGTLIAKYSWKEDGSIKPQRNTIQGASSMTAFLDKYNY